MEEQKSELLGDWPGAMVEGSFWRRRCWRERVCWRTLWCKASKIIALIDDSTQGRGTYVFTIDSPCAGSHLPFRRTLDGRRGVLTLFFRIKPTDYDCPVNVVNSRIECGDLCWRLPEDLPPRCLSNHFTEDQMLRRYVFLFKFRTSCLIRQTLALSKSHVVSATLNQITGRDMTKSWSHALHDLAIPSKNDEEPCESHYLKAKESYSGILHNIGCICKVLLSKNLDSCCVNLLIGTLRYKRSTTSVTEGILGDLKKVSSACSSLDL